MKAFVILVAICVLVCGGNPAYAQLGGLLKKLPGVSKPPAGGAAPANSAAPVALRSSEAIRQDLDASILEIGVARKMLLEAQVKLAESLGIKEKADEILSATKVLGEGGVIEPKTAADEEQLRVPTEKMKALIEEHAAVAGELTEEQKVLFAEGKNKFALGVAAEGLQIAGIVALADETAQSLAQMKGNVAKAAELPKAMAMAAAAGKLATLLPNDVKAMHQTWQLIRQVGAKNQIEVEDIDISKYMPGAGAPTES